VLVSGGRFGMSELGQLILIGIIIALEPLPNISFILVLSSRARTRAGWAFLAGWTGSFVAVVTITMIFTGDASDTRASVPSTVLCVVQLLLGLLLIVVGLRRLREGATSSAEPHALLRRLNALTLPGAAAIGALIQPWPLIAAGTVTVLHADLSQQEAALAIVAFGLLASAAILGMQIFAIAAPERADDRLGALRRWLESHQRVAVTGLALVLGGWLVIEGSAGLF
jgi:threonine/homoserine/homoserine lactone efflux protein